MGCSSSHLIEASGLSYRKANGSGIRTEGINIERLLCTKWTVGVNPNYIVPVGLIILGYMEFFCSVKEKGISDYVRSPVHSKVLS